ncbi:hypothetical protein D9756_009718 [Leucocoprinus leucothites]|uniref:Helicase C-terminal domain-containing protein n=1 Tax=Leucocoprinus leucothites TaxID=201217 RepID=A0A8H5FTQ6_9AGAR|nr:hypothetical protein D9756_009718 [Leucoagaricus leucothites]
MQYPISSAKDLVCVLQLTNDKPPPKFMAFVNKQCEVEDAAEKIWDDTVFVNKEHEVEDAVEEVWNDMLIYLEDKITYFHSGISPEFQESHIAMLRHGELWGIICTDAAGMGLNLPNVELVIQNAPPTDLMPTETVSTPLSTTASADSMSTTGSMKVSRRHCRLCWSTPHIIGNPHCPRYNDWLEVQREKDPNKENAAPTQHRCRSYKEPGHRLGSTKCNNFGSADKQQSHPLDLLHLPQA